MRPNSNVIFRSSVPEGYAVVPVLQRTGEKVAAVSTPDASARNYLHVAMLNIPAYKKGDDTKIKVDFSGAITGARANIFITPRKDGPTEVRMRFHELKDAPAGQNFILWAVSPDNKFSKLGQVVNVAGRNEAEIKSETSLPDFGLVVTMESAVGEAPARPDHWNDSHRSVNVTNLARRLRQRVAQPAALFSSSRPETPA